MFSVFDESLRDLIQLGSDFHSNDQQGWQFLSKSLRSHHQDVLRGVWGFCLCIWIPPFEIGLQRCSHSRVYIPAQHQMCNDVIAGHAYTAVPSESCDLSARRASSPKPYPGCCGGDSSLDIIISAFLSPGHPGSLFVCFNFPVTGKAQFVQQGSKITLLLCLLLRKETIVQQAKSDLRNETTPTYIRLCW